MKLRLLIALLFCSALWAVSDAAKTVSTAGTAETLVASSIRVRWALVQADCDNTNNAYVGWDSTPKTAGGVELDACESVEYSAEKMGLPYFDLVSIYVDVDTDGEGVHFQYSVY